MKKFHLRKKKKSIKIDNEASIESAPITGKLLSFKISTPSFVPTAKQLITPPATTIIHFTLQPQTTYRTITDQSPANPRNNVKSRHKSERDPPSLPPSTTELLAPTVRKRARNPGRKGGHGIGDQSPRWWWAAAFPILVKSSTKNEPLLRLQRPRGAPLPRFPRIYGKQRQPGRCIFLATSRIGIGHGARGVNGPITSPIISRIVRYTREYR